MLIVVNCISIYKCLSDETRLRILNLLQNGPLCVCHVQAALELPQAKVSKQLAYLKKNGLLESHRKFNWTIYEIPQERDPLLDVNLSHLSESVFSQSSFRDDLAKLQKIDTTVATADTPSCCS